MVKAYLRYEETAAFGVVVSPDSNICYDNSGKLLLVGALEQFQVWNVKQGRCVHSLSPAATGTGVARPSVTAIACMPSGVSVVTVGYSDGSIRVWDIVKGTTEMTLSGHKSSVTALRYNLSGSLLASGSKDTDIIVWDPVAESGLFRLRGHRDQVTDILFLKKGRRLVSCSKDTFVRVWDLETQHCVQTVVDHRGEVWSIDVDLSERFLVAGSVDVDLHVYAIAEDLENDAVSAVGRDGAGEVGSGTTERSKWDVLQPLGNIKRQSGDRVVTVRFNSFGTLLGCQEAGKTIEIYRLRDQSEAIRKAKRRKKRKKEKAAKLGGNLEDEEETAEKAKEDQVEEIVAADQFELLQVFRSKQKLRSFVFSPGAVRKGVLATMSVSLHSNSLEVYDLLNDASSRTNAIELPGHRSTIRAVILSPDSSLLMTTSHNLVKIWNPQTCACLRTMDSGYAISGVFVPGNRYAVVGTKAGSLEIFDINAAERIKEVKAHTGAVWSIAANPDGSGFVSGSGDRQLKVWEYQLVSNKDNETKQLDIKSVGGIDMRESDILCVCFSPDGKFLAVGQQDSQIRVFLADSFKFVFQLYGHKLPVLCIDISSDGTLLASGSADKNVKIWGMDFGDLHKSLFAHADYVVGVHFVPNTHYLFSVSKDHMVKYWDADKFELLLTLGGHHAEVWSLAVSTHGDFVVTGSHDRSVRRWDRTDEPFFIEEEKEKRMEALFETGFDGSGSAPATGDAPQEGAASVVGQKSKETTKAVDSIIEALDLAEAESERLHEIKAKSKDGKELPFQPNPMLLGYSPSFHVLRTMSSVRPSDLEQALLTLPFTDVLKLMGYLKDWLTEGNQVELVSRITTLLVRLHYEQLTATAAARPLLTTLQNDLHKSVQGLKDTIGFNLAAMGHLQHLLGERSDVMFKDAGAKLNEVRAKLGSAKESLPHQGLQKKKKRKKPDAAA